MDLKDPKIKSLALITVSILGVIFLWYWLFYSEQLKEIKVKQTIYSQKMIDLRNVQLKSKSLEQLKADYDNLMVKYREIELLLPEVKMVPSFLVQLNTASSLTGIKIISIEPEPIQSEDFYNVASFRVQLVGTYHDFGRFAGYLANFPFIVNVSNMSIESLAGTQNVGVPSDKNNDKNTIRASFTLSTYFVKPEERLKELDI